MSSYAYYNGKFGKRDEITIPLNDRAIFFSDAVYDAAIGSYDRILWEEEHIDRFFSNAAKIGMNHSFTKHSFSQLLHEIGIKSMLKSYFIYFQISRALPTRVHSAKGSDPTLLITVDEITISQNPEPLKLIIREDKRYDFCDIKTTNLLPNVLASTEADNKGFDEAVFVKKGVVTECAKSNISIIKRGRLITHPKCSKILPGITREHLLSICKEHSIPFLERPFTVDELLSADEILVTGTGKLCKKVSYIENKNVGGNDPTLSDFLCQKMYKEYTEFCQIR